MALTSHSLQDQKTSRSSPTKRWNNKLNTHTIWSHEYTSCPHSKRHVSIGKNLKAKWGSIFHCSRDKWHNNGCPLLSLFSDSQSVRGESASLRTMWGTLRHTVRDGTGKWVMYKWGQDTPRTWNCQLSGCPQTIILVVQSKFKDMILPLGPTTLPQHGFVWFSFRIGESITTFRFSWQINILSPLFHHRSVINLLMLPRGNISFVSISSIKNLFERCSLLRQLVQVYIACSWVPCRSMTTMASCSTALQHWSWSVPKLTVSRNSRGQATMMVELMEAEETEWWR